MPPIPLAADEVHAWHILPERIDRPDLVDRCEALLSADERDRWGRFAHRADARHYLVAHAMLRSVLSQYVEVAAGDWRFESNEFGRPHVADPEAGRALQFNLSHTLGLVACAVAWARPIGVDVENVERANVGLDLAANYFSPQEAVELRSLPVEAQSERFFEYWTLKEAYLKARGVGLSLPLDRFSIELRPERSVGISFSTPLDDDPDRWHFARFRPTPRHMLAVAVQRLPGEKLSVSARSFGPAELGSAR